MQMLWMDVLLRYASVSTNYYTDSISIFQSRNKPVLCGKYFIGTAWGNWSNVDLYPLNSTRVRFPEVALASVQVSTTTKTAKFSNFIYKVLVLLSFDNQKDFSNHFNVHRILKYKYKIRKVLCLTTLMWRIGANRENLKWASCLNCTN